MKKELSCALLYPPSFKSNLRKGDNRRYHYRARDDKQPNQTSLFKFHMGIYTHEINIVLHSSQVHRLSFAATKDMPKNLCTAWKQTEITSTDVQ